MRNYAGTCNGIYSYNLVCSFLIQLLPLQNSVFVVHFSNAFWHRNEAFLKRSSQNEIVPLLVIFHLPYSQYRGLEICFHSCRCQNQNFSLVSHLRRTLVARVWHQCCKIDQIIIHCNKYHSIFNIYLTHAKEIASYTSTSLLVYRSP